MAPGVLRALVERAQGVPVGPMKTLSIALALLSVLGGAVLLSPVAAQTDADPVVRAILAGDETTGVSLMQMDETLDTGQVFATVATGIRPDETAGTLTARLAALGAVLVAENLEGAVSGDLAAVPQDDAPATAAGMVGVEEAFLDPARHSAEAVAQAVRAFNPWPGAWTRLVGRRFKIWSARLATGPGPDPGTAAAAGQCLVDEGRELVGDLAATYEHCVTDY